MLGGRWESFSGPRLLPNYCRTNALFSPTILGPALSRGAAHIVARP
jgi:hypothetical protein